jgi:preprotein translocase subunit SecE
MVAISMLFFWLVDAGVSASVNEVLRLAAGR